MAVQERREAEQLEFLFPGIVHTLGNQLFSIHGNAQFLGQSGRAPDRLRTAILEAAQRAEQALEILRSLDTDPDHSGPTAQAGVLLSRLASLCKVPLRERAIRLDLEHSSHETPRLVNVTRMARSLIEVLRQLCAELPLGIEGRLRIDLSEQRGRAIAVRLRLEVEATFLPFPLDLESVCSAVRDYLEDLEVGLEGPVDGCELTLRLPTVRGA